MKSVPLEAYVVTPFNAMRAVGDAAAGDAATMFVLQALTETLRHLKRGRKRCMLAGCGRWLQGVTGHDAPVAFCIMIPMFPHTGPDTDTAISSPICLDCFRRGDFMARLKETLVTDYECTVREAVTQ